MKEIDELKATASLAGDALSQFAKLFQNEVDLAKAEVAEKASQAARAAGLLVGAAILAIPVLTMVLFALAALLIARDWSEPIAYLVAALVGAIIAGVLAYFGMRKLAPENLTPSETLGQLQKDKQAVKGLVQ
ncbi:MAG: phage holin family protein [Xanthobacteraceae bacterium]